MSRGPWADPAVEEGFAAAYAPVQERRRLEEDAVLVDAGPVDDRPVATAQDEADEAADLAARPLTRDGRRVRAAQPGRLSPQRAVAGAAVSVAGVLLGIGTLLWLSDDPSDGPGPVVQAPPAQELATQPEVESAPVDPVEVPAPAAPAPAAPAPVAPPAPVAAAEPAVPEVPVVVLNNSRVEGLADTAAAVFRRGGWPVASTGNFRGRIPATTVYYEDGQEAVAREFAGRFEEVVRVRPRFATLPARGLVVVVTRDFRS